MRAEGQEWAWEGKNLAVVRASGRAILGLKANTGEEVTSSIARRDLHHTPSVTPKNGCPSLDARSSAGGPRRTRDDDSPHTTDVERSG